MPVIHENPPGVVPGRADLKLQLAGRVSSAAKEEKYHE